MYLVRGAFLQKGKKGLNALVYGLKKDKRLNLVFF